MNDMTTPNSQALVQESADVLVQARAFKIVTADDYREAGERLKLVKGLDARISDFFDPHIKRAYDAHKALVADKNRAAAPLKDAETVYKRLIRGYEDEQEKIRLAAQAKAEEAARKERERLEKQAQKAAEQGKAEKAAQLETRAQTVATPVIASSTPKLEGISTRVSWKAEVVDKMALVKAVAAGTVPLTALEPNLTFLGQQARSLKSELNYPGIRVFEDRGISSRSAR